MAFSISCLDNCGISKSAISDCQIWDWYNLFHLCSCTKAAGSGHLTCLKYAHENGCPWDAGTCSWAAGSGQLDCLRYAHENGCPWDAGTCASAARNGHLECLKYVHENGCPWDAETCERAALYGHLECLRYVYENGCPLANELYIRDVSCARYLLKIEKTPSGPIDILRRAAVKNLVEEVFTRVLESEMSRAAAIIAGRWLEHRYRPGGAGFSDAKRDFEEMR